MLLKRQSFELISNFKLKQADDESTELIIEGYANTTSKDRSGDVVLKDAWENGGLKNFKKNPIILAFHDRSKPIGKAIGYDITDKGLYISAQISKAAGNVYNLVKEGILKTFSVSIAIKDAEYDKKSDTFIIKAVDLLEVSVVSIPANTNSVFSVKKSLDNEDYVEFKKQYTLLDSQEELGTVDKEHENKKEEASSINKNDLEGLKKEILGSLGETLKGFKEELLSTNKEEEDKELNKENNMTHEVSGVEKLLADITKRLESADESKSLLSSIEDLKGELKEKAKEIEDLKKSKMQFSEKQESFQKSLSTLEKDEAVLLSKIVGKSVDGTKLAKQIIEKAPVSDHLGAAMNDGWEQEFSTRLFGDIREKLIVEPMFTNVNMNAPTMHIPINPEAGYGEWIDSTLYKDAATSTGAAKTHSLLDRTLVAYKLAAKEYIGYEEEEDSIIPILPIVRDAIIRRMAKSSDKALLLGTGVGTTNPSTSDPISGLSTLATAGSKVLQAADQPSVATDKVTVDSLTKTRRLLGVWGHNPGDVVYIVSHDAYFDLLEDPDFRTMDLVGDRATILTGQIGSANGSPVVVSGEYATKGAGAVFVTALNKSNFIKGQLRSVMVERDRDIEFQRNVLVATRRLGFLQVIDGEGVATGAWKA